MNTVKNYLSLIKFSHTIFAMPFALIGFTLGIFYDPNFEGQWNLNKTIGWARHDYFGDSRSWTSLFIKLILVVGCMIFARSAAMAFNRYLDRKFDAKNPRTAIREIPAGILKADRVLLFTIICSLLFCVCAFFINLLCFYLSPIALFVVLGYSYTKRFTALCHLILGLGLSLAPIGAFLAVTGQFDLIPILFSLTVICWVSGFDIIYALQDIDFDKSNKLYSIPAAMGKNKALKISELLHIGSAGLIISVGIAGNFHWLYWIGVVVFISMLLYQHAIIKPTDLSRVNLAFMTANGIASIFFAGFVIGDLLVYRY
ncbi:MAG: UbiA-like polyprenyltransferase [Chitinophagaceae bacterium]